MAFEPNLGAGSLTWESRKFCEVVDEEVSGRGRALEPEDFQNKVFHALDLSLRVRVVRDVTEFGNFRRVNLLVLPLGPKKQI